jgi:hypothetical protein
VRAVAERSRYLPSSRQSRSARWRLSVRGIGQALVGLGQAAVHAGIVGIDRQGKQQRRDGGFGIAFG